jgi:2-polyprenyl-6-methoxyphenol hydroxylase-like FAD-dependent oxidoreductase
MTDGAKLGERAVVVGGGMGGLFAARVLSDHFDEVVVVDRDHEPSGGESRKMVPQGDHFHVLLPGGLDAMTDWFPGFVDDLVDTGSVEMQLGRDFYAYTPMGKSYSIEAHVPDPVDGGDMTYVQTRPQLEANVRRRVESVDNITLQFRTLIDGPLVEDGRIVGVSVRDGDDLHADLVVDASGRNSLTAQWLPGLGYDKAPETYVNCDVQYASAVVEPRYWDAFVGSVIFFMPSGEGEHPARSGAVVKLPDEQWLLLLGTRYDDSVPTDWEGYREFGRTLITSVWDELVDGSAQVTDVKTYRMPRAVRHHYEHIDRFPEGLLPIGDSVCFFNPTHGQGMSAAAGQCRGLETILGDRAARGARLDGLAMEFFPVAAEWVRGPWILAAMSDFANPDCTGDFPNDDLPDLMLLGETAAAATPGSPEMQLVNDIGTLRLPLSAIRNLQPV